MSFANNVKTELAAAATAAATELAIVTAQAPFNNPPSDGRIMLSDSLRSPTVFEVIGYSGLTDNGDGTLTLTGLTRGMEDTTAAAWDAGAFVYQSLTAEQAAQMMTSGTRFRNEAGTEGFDVQYNSVDQSLEFIPVGA